MSKRAWFVAAMATFLLFVAPAAAFGKTVLVSTSGTDAPACGTSQANACRTIGAALGADGNAVDGDTVSVGAGTFTEQLTITKGITLDGAGPDQTTIASPGHPMSANCTGANEAVVCADAASAPVTVENLTVDASGPGSDSGCGDSPENIYALNTSITVNNTVDEHARESPTASLGGCQSGLAVTVDNTDATARTATITNNSVSDYQKNGITVTGAGLSFSISGNTVSSDPSSVIGTNGIEVGETKGGTISANTVSGNECNLSGACGADPISDAQAAGIILFDNGPTTVSGNHLSANDIGLISQDFGNTPSTVSVISNTLSGNRDEGLFAGAGTMNASDNTITGSNIGVENASFNNPSFADPSNATLNLTDNSIRDNGVGLEQDVDQAGSNHPVSTAHDNAMTGNGKGIVNNTSQTVNASDNLLTCDAGSGSACVTGSGVTTSPLTLKVSAAAAQIGIPGQTTTVTAELVDSAGTVVSGAAVPDGSTFGFATSLGSIPASAQTTNGVATVTLTSGSSTGTATVAAAFQDVAATTNVGFTGTLAVTSGPPPTTTTTTPPPTTTIKTVTQVLPLIITGATTTATKHGVVTLVAVNPGTSSIPVTVTLSMRQHGKAVRIAKRAATIRAHKTALIRLQLSKAALKTLRKAHHLKVTETAASSGTTLASSALTVRF